MVLSIYPLKAFDAVAVREAVLRQQHIYPDITLQDLYKSFFQDRFGPEHLVSDSATVAKYILEELKTSDILDGPKTEPTGYLQNYQRVNLLYIQNGEISIGDFVHAFMESAKTSVYSIDEWKKEWRQIDEVIASMDLNLSDYAETRMKLFNLIDSGKYVMHHSSSFHKYNFHYRIISTEIFLQYFKKQ